MEKRIDSNLQIEGEPDQWVHSACLLCSNGCGMDIAVRDGRIAGVRGNADGVATASAEIAQGNQDLSGRTEAQASTPAELGQMAEKDFALWGTLIKQQGIKSIE